MMEALDAEKELRTKARRKQKLNGMPVNPPAGVLLERGIEAYAEQQKKLKASEAVAAALKASSSRGRFAGLCVLRAKKKLPGLLDAELQPPPEVELPCGTAGHRDRLCHGGMHAACGDHA